MENDWQNKLTNVTQRIMHLHKTELFCDCEFIVNDKKIRCHKLILASASPVFEVMFFGSMSAHEDPTAPIAITDIDFITFKQMISYIYNDDMKINSYKNAYDLYHSAKKYMLQNLIKRCINYLGEHIDYNNVLQTFEFAKFYSESNLEKLCIKEIQINTSNVLRSESLIETSECTLSTIMNMKRLNISSELELVTAVERWAHAEAGRKGCSNPRNVANTLVQKLRFLTLTLEEFISDPVNSELLNDTEKLEILLRIIKPEMSPMGNLLSEKKIKRKQRKVRCLATLDIKEVHEAICDGSEWLTSIFITNSRIELLGIELKLQFNDTDDYYLENIVVRVGLTSEQDHFAEGSLQDLVPYNNKAEIMFNKVTSLEPFKQYEIHVFLCSAGIYPLGKHSSLACENSNVEIKFVSHSSWERSQPCNMTVLSSIIYSDPSD